MVKPADRTEGSKNSPAIPSLKLPTEETLQFIVFFFLWPAIGATSVLSRFNQRRALVAISHAFNVALHFLSQPSNNFLRELAWHFQRFERSFSFRDSMKRRPGRLAARSFLFRRAIRSRNFNGYDVAGITREYADILKESRANVCRETLLRNAGRNFNISNSGARCRFERLQYCFNLFEI